MTEVTERIAADPEKLERVVQVLLDEARARGADQAEAAASHDVGLSVTARLGDVENIEFTNDRCAKQWPKPAHSRKALRRIRIPD